MITPRGRPLSRYISGVVGAVLFPCLLIIGLLGHQWVTEAQGRLEDRTAAFAARVLADVDTFLTSQIAMLQALATSPALDAGDVRQFDRQARHLAALQNIDVILRDRNDQQVVNTRLPFGTPLSRNSLPTDAVVLKTRLPAVSDFVRGPLTGNPLVVVSVPVLRNGDVAYFLNASIPVDVIGDLLKKAGIVAPYSGSVTDRRGIIIARSLNTETTAGKPLPGFGDVTGSEGTWSGRNPLGVAVFATFKRSTLSGWLISIGIESAALQEPLNASLRVIIPIILALVYVALALAAIVRRQILEAHRSLVAAARAVGDGRETAGVTTAVREVTEIGATLAAASVKLRQQADDLQAANRDLESRVAARTRELAEQQALLSATLDNMDQGLILVDRDRRAKVVSQRAVALLDLDPDMVRDQPTSDEIIAYQIRKGEFALASDAMRAVISAEGIDGRRTHVYERTRPNGRVLEIRTVPLPDGSAVRTYTDITARKEIEQALEESRQRAERALAQAEAASLAKGEFLATMSHEIRTPLHGALGHADLLLREGGLSERQRHHAERIQCAGQALLTVVNDVLDFSKIEAGQIDLDPQPFAPEALIEEAVGIVRSAADAKHLSLAVRIDPTGPGRVVGDPDRLRQVLLNLLNNAIKFTAAGGVTLTLSAEPRPARACRIRVCVSDTGIGIAPEKRARLFQRFSQVDGSIRREYGGTGLGLAISRRLIEAMGGQIGVESLPGEGSTFWFEVVLPRAVAGREDPAGADGGQAAPLRPARVLLADDNAINQDIARAMLEAAGHAVDVVGDGEEAIQAVRAGRYDLVLMDVQMAGVDGLTATRRIRALDHPAARLPIIAMTANVLPQQVAQFLTAGMDGHLGKPFRRQDLLAVVAHWSRAGRPEVPGAFPVADPWTGPVLDRTVYEEMLGAAGREAMLGLLVRLAADLRSRFGPSNGRERLAADAHATASAAGQLGFTRLSDLCRDLEQACATQRDLAVLLTRVSALRDEVLTEIAQLSAAA
jgi:signal transduction histidine kinase/DNA-binding response OmpR family regulator